LSITIGFGVSRQVVIDGLTFVPKLDLGYAPALLSTGPTGRLSLDNGTSFRPDNPFSSRDIITAGAGIGLLALQGR
jgi:hypothetical protein